ncbi:MAG: hypothetical protein IJ048_13900 [Clostridia bacterium]|nr:hypothetical protein [Clostridia bacterium]
MKKVFRLVGVTIVILLALIIAFTYTPAKWLLRANCLCGRAYYHAGETFAPDDMLFHEIGWREFSDEQMHVMRIHCQRHHEGVWVQVWGKDAYSVQLSSK